MKNKRKILTALVGIACLAIGFTLGSSFKTAYEYISYNLKSAKTDTVSMQQRGTVAPKLPTQLDFAGESVPLDDLEVRERLDRELIINSYAHIGTILLLKRGHQWGPLIRRILKEENVPEDFFYLCMAESHLSQVTSPEKASGFWQFLKPTAIQYGLVVDDEVDERYHVEKATYAACKYLKDSYNRLGSWSLAAAGYNMGMAGAGRQASEQGSKNYYDLYLNEETSRYLFRILAIKTIIENPTHFNFHLDPSDLYPPVEYRQIAVSKSVNSWIEFAQQNGISYKILRKHNPWIRSKSLKNSSNRTYYVQVPI